MAKFDISFDTFKSQTADLGLALKQGSGVFYIKTTHHGTLRQLRSNLPAWLLGKIFLASRWLARHPNNEYGGRYYPVRLYEHAFACVQAIEDFVGAIRERRPPLCTVDEASRTVLACLAGVESYRTNRPVRVRPLEEVMAAPAA